MRTVYALIKTFTEIKVFANKIKQSAQRSLKRAAVFLSIQEGKTAQLLF